MPADHLTEAAPAKVNLTLHVTGRRADGYHLLDSLVVFAGVGDVLHAHPAPTLSLDITGPFAAGLTAEADNLVLRAARLFAEATGCPEGAALTLEKHLPVASGIGGGSADAAATLRLLGRLWNVPPAHPELAQKLGADVPVCLLGRPVRMRGIGEIQEPVPVLPDLGLLLVNPLVPVATAEVFRTRTAPFSEAAPLAQAWPDASALAGWLRLGANDLEPPARRLRPEIDNVLDGIAGIPGCLLSRMSGSGATCFGLFPDPGSAVAATSMLADRGWWCWGGGLNTAT